MAMTIFDVLSKIDKGGLVEEANERMAAVAREVERTGNKGTLTIKIDIEQNDANELLIGGSVSSKAPAHKHGQSVFYTDEAGGLHRRDPNQGDLPLIREIGNA